MPPASFLSAPEPAAELREEELRRALDRHELQIYYQPVLSLATGEITGAEALLRWQHPRRGLLSPRDFVPLAEETGLIFTMCERLLHDTCAQGAVWSQAGHPDIRLLLNLSQREFQDARLPRLVREVLRATRTDPASLQLEITERVVLQDVLSGIKALEALAATGIRVALDDAGTDRSLLRHLDRLPLHALKLDGTLVRRIAADPHAAALIAEITARAHSREMRVIALGVETEEQLALVREHQCDEVQGYLFHRAAPADRFAALLKEGWSVSADLFPVDLAETVGAPHVGRN